MGNLDGLGFSFHEPMDGWLGIGDSDPVEGRMRGQRENTPISFQVKVSIDDLGTFLNLTDHMASLTGTVTFEPLGGTFTIRNGRFNLFSADRVLGIRTMTYSFQFQADDGRTYFLHGHKEIKDDMGPFDMVTDMTTLFTRVYEGETDQAPIYGAGEIYFRLSDSASLLASMRVTGDAWPWQKVAGISAFMSFAYGTLREEYLGSLRLFYNTSYENLVLSGVIVDQVRGEKPFFLVSGVHDKGFPWGDGEIFWDVLLVVGDETSGYERYCITDRVLDGLKLDVPRGRYYYKGPIFRLEEGYSTSFTRILRKHAGLVQCEAEFTIRFEAKAFATTPLPFVQSETLLARLSYNLKQELRNLVPSEHLLGIFITPHAVSVSLGSLRITCPDRSLDASIVSDRSFGEAESATLKNIKEPTLLYGYICAVAPDRKLARVQIHSRALRNERQDWGKDKLDAFVGAVVSRLASVEMLISEDDIKITKLARNDQAAGEPDWLTRVGDPILEVNNDHFPTAIFQRRVIRVRTPSGSTCLGLEENMDLMRREAVRSEAVCTVAAIKSENKIGALESVLEFTGFWKLLEEKVASSGKSRENFLITIKPNFMFAYNRADKSTFTDPELVGHLVSLLTAPGKDFRNIAVVEAQSTYGEYFDRRSVKEVAEYLGYDLTGNSGYRVIDLTEEAVSRQHLGPHLGDHPVPPTWTNADFRISFAKNKTHPYAYYTLTIKNIYGALPLANKFKEYHCDRDIFHTTIEYLTAFPVDYGLIDAYLSADGPFGIFADPSPNFTKTVIGGDNLVAVDWVGATKMGIDPLISKYMQLAVEAFGKPEINFFGDPDPYHPWLNVPAALTVFALKGLDANHYFGNLMYMTGAYMDSSFFTHKNRSEFVQQVRAVIRPLQELMFVQAGGELSSGARMISQILSEMGE